MESVNIHPLTGLDFEVVGGKHSRASLSEEFNQVIFQDIFDTYPNDSDIITTIKYPNKFVKSEEDKVLLFEVGWSSVNDYVYAAELKDNYVKLCGQAFPKDVRSLYQLCYCIPGNRIVGVSKPFNFQFVREEELIEYSRNNEDSILSIKSRFAVLMDKYLMSLEQSNLNRPQYNVTGTDKQEQENSSVEDKPLLDDFVAVYLSDNGSPHFKGSKEKIPISDEIKISEYTSDFIKDSGYAESGIRLEAPRKDHHENDVIDNSFDCSKLSNSVNSLELISEKFSKMEDNADSTKCCELLIDLDEDSKLTDEIRTKTDDNLAICSEIIDSDADSKSAIEKCTLMEDKANLGLVFTRDELLETVDNQFEQNEDNERNVKEDLKVDCNQDAATEPDQLVSHTEQIYIQGSKAIIKPPASGIMEEKPISKAIIEPPASDIKEEQPISEAIIEPPASDIKEENPISEAIIEPPASDVKEKKPKSEAIIKPSASGINGKNPIKRKTLIPATSSEILIEASSVSIDEASGLQVCKGAGGKVREVDMLRIISKDGAEFSLSGPKIAEVWMKLLEDRMTNKKQKTNDKHATTTTTTTTTTSMTSAVVSSSRPGIDNGRHKNTGTKDDIVEKIMRAVYNERMKTESDPNSTFESFYSAMGYSQEKCKSKASDSSSANSFPKMEFSHGKCKWKAMYEKERENNGISSELHKKNINELELQNEQLRRIVDYLKRDNMLWYIRNTYQPQTFVDMFAPNGVYRTMVTFDNGGLFKGTELIIQTVAKGPKWFMMEFVGEARSYLDFVKRDESGEFKFVEEQEKPITIKIVCKERCFEVFLNEKVSFYALYEMDPRTITCAYFVTNFKIGTITMHGAKQSCERCTDLEQRLHQGALEYTKLLLKYNQKERKERVRIVKRIPRNGSNGGNSTRNGLN